MLNLLDFSEYLLNLVAWSIPRGEVLGQELFPFLLRVCLFLIAQVKKKYYDRLMYSPFE